MYLYFDRNGTLKEQITVSPPRVGDINVNKIYVFWEDHSPVNGYCVFRKPDGTNTTSIPVVEFVNEIIPYDQERDLYFFHYNTTYRFAVFEMPSDADSGNNIFIPSGTNINSVLFSCWLVYNDDNEQKTKGMGLVAFAIEPTTLSVEHDQNINVAQWNELVNLITGESQFDSINVNEINFRPTNNPSETGLSMKDNVIYWQGTPLATKTQVVLLTTDQSIAGKKLFNDEVVHLDKVTFNAVTNLFEITNGVVKHNIKVDNLPETSSEIDVILPNESGTLLNENTGVDIASEQTIEGEKQFNKQISVAEKISIFGNDTGDTFLSTQADNSGDSGAIVQHNLKTKGPAVDGEVYNHTLPNSNGDLLDVNNGVTIITNQTIEGKKTFNDKTTFNDDITINNEGVITFNESQDGDNVIIVKTPNATHNIKVEDSGGVSNIKLPNSNGEILTESTGVTLNTNQEINGEKIFNKKIRIDDIEVNADAIQINSKNTDYNYNASHNIKTKGYTGTNLDYDIFLPNIDGTLIADEGDATINGKKTFTNLNVSMQGGPTDNGSLAYNTNNNKYYGRIGGVNKEILTEDALTPTILTPVVSDTLPNIPGGTTNVPIVNFQGTYTVPVIAGFTINAATTDTTAVLSINQDTGVISIDLASGNSIELSWYYETTRKGFYFNIGSDYNGIYVFTFNYLMMLVPIYGLTEKKIYKFAGPGIQDFTTGSVINMLYNMVRAGNYLYVWSGRSEYQIASGVTGTLVKVKLY